MENLHTLAIVILASTGLWLSSRVAARRPARLPVAVPDRAKPIAR